jgi:hypothetical protein
MEIEKLYEKLCSDFEELTYESKKIEQFVRSYESIFHAQNLVIDLKDTFESYILARQVYIYACSIIKKIPKKKKELRKEIIDKSTYQYELEMKEIEELQAIYDPNQELVENISTNVYNEMMDGREFLDNVNDEANKRYLKKLRECKLEDEENTNKKMKLEEEFEELQDNYDPDKELIKNITTKIHRNMTNEEEFINMINEKANEEYFEELRKKKRKSMDEDNESNKFKESDKRIKTE